MKHYVKRDRHKFYEKSALELDSTREVATIKSALRHHIEYMRANGFEADDQFREMYDDAVAAYDALENKNEMPWR